MRRISLLAIILLASCAKGNKDLKEKGFTLTVTAKNFPDSTQVYLYDEAREIILDSTYVLNEKFKLSGQVDLPVLGYLFFYDLENKPIDHYKYLYLENKDIAIDGEYSDFFNAQVTGSDQTDLMTAFDSVSANSETSKKISDQLDFLFSNANNQMAISNILYKKKEISKDSLLLFYTKLDAINSNSPKGQELLAYSKTISLKIGDKFRDISGNDLQGVEHKLSDYYGKVILLDFWSPDCPYSSQQHEKEFPKLIQKYNPEDFIIISYFIDEEKKDWEKLVKKEDANWLIISDLKGIKGENLSKYDVTGSPINFLIDKNGIVVFSSDGYYEGQNKIEKAIDELLQ